MVGGGEEAGRNDSVVSCIIHALRRNTALRECNVNVILGTGVSLRCEAHDYIIYCYL